MTVSEAAEDEEWKKIIRFFSTKIFVNAKIVFSAELSTVRL